MLDRELDSGSVCSLKITARIAITAMVDQGAILRCRCQWDDHATVFERLFDIRRTASRATLRPGHFIHLDLLLIGLLLKKQFLSELKKPRVPKREIAIRRRVHLE